MSTLKRSFNFLGEKITVEMTRPTNEEHNSYAAKRMEIETDDELRRFRAAEFDKRCTSCTPVKKEDIYDSAKSSVMFQIFENFGVDAKN